MVVRRLFDGGDHLGQGGGSAVDCVRGGAVDERLHADARVYFRTRTGSGRVNRVFCRETRRGDTAGRQNFTPAQRAPASRQSSAHVALPLVWNSTTTMWRCARRAVPGAPWAPFAVHRTFFSASLFFKYS